MNSAVQDALNTLESKLQELIESVASYNPSPGAAQALVQADDELTETLEKLDEHQQAHRRILSLRETSNVLDGQLTDLLTTLSETRQQLLSVPSTRYPDPPREVSYTQLLSYASKISKYSRPPNPAAFKKYASAVLPPPPPPSQQAASAAASGEDATAGESKPAEEDTSMKIFGLSEEENLNLDPSGMMPFTPWPNEVVMRQGALAAVGPQGVPEDMVPEEEKKAAEEKKKQEEEMEKGPVNGGPSEAEEKARRNSYAPAHVPQRAKPANLSLDLWAEEEDDD